MDPSSSTGASKAQSRKHYIRTLHKVIEESDIVILVLDARDPEGCRSRLVEEEVRRREHEGKKLVFVLNKIGMPHMLSPFFLFSHAPSRLGAAQQRGSVAAIPPAFDTHSSVQVVHAAAAHESHLPHLARPPQSPQGLQAGCDERHCGGCGLSERGQEQSDQLPQTRKGPCS